MSRSPTVIRLPRARQARPAEAAALPSSGTMLDSMQLQVPGLLPWLGLALGSLLVAGLFAFAIAMARTPLVQLLPTPATFYTFLVGHVTFALTVWLLCALCLVAIIVAAQGGAPVSGRVAGVGAGIAGVGVVFMAVSAFLGLGQPLLNDFVPVLDHPLFYLGLALTTLGVLLPLGGFLLTYPRWRELTAESMGASLAAITVVVSMAVMAVMVATVSPEGVEHAVWVRSLFWGPGQVLLFAETMLMATAWVMLVKLVAPSHQSWEPWARRAMFLYLPFLAVLVSALLGGDAGRNATVDRWVANAISGPGLGLPSILLMGLVVTQLLKSPVRPWAGPRAAARMALIGSILLYSTGGLIAAAGFRSDLRVPAHYHGTVGAVTLALMGIVICVLGRQRARLARWQPALYGGGLTIMIVGLYWAGLLGAPRKTFGFQWADLPAIVAMNVMGLGAFLAVVGGALFILLTLPPLVRRVAREARPRAVAWGRARLSWSP